MIRVTRFAFLAAWKSPTPQSQRYGDGAHIRRPLVSAMLTMFVFAASAGTVHAQGSRKDDVVFNAQGRPMAGATVRVCTSAATGQPCAPLALIYSDAALTQALANPLSADGLGNYNFYAAPGRYMVEISGPGITTKQIPNVILPNDPSSPTFTSVTTTSGISAFSMSLTGNLTVNGSTAVVGSLTVGGLPVPTTSADNQWMAGQRFKGPIPWRDVTAYMPAGGCSSNDTGTPGTTTGSMTSGSPTLTLTAAKDFKNGCGIAVPGAGPATAAAAPSAQGNISTISRSSNVVTVTCTSTCGFPVGGFGNTNTGVIIAGSTGGATSFNGTFQVTAAPSTTTFTYSQTGPNESGTPSTGTFNTLWGYAHGTAGATTYNYKIVTVDFNGGYSAASPAIQITNGNATLSTNNYNWIQWNQQPAAMYWIYGDKGLGGALTCVGTSFTYAYSDFGLSFPCTADAPTNPPASPGRQSLYTTIVSGAGTTTLTLAANAQANVTTVNIYHDETSFLNSCLTDELNDRVTITGQLGCLIPAGNYFINGHVITADAANRFLNIKVQVSGSLTLQTYPIFLTGGFEFAGIGNGGSGNSFQHTIQSYLLPGRNVPASFVLSNNTNVVRGFQLVNVAGHGIVLTPGVGNSAGANSTGLYDLGITELNSISGAGSPIMIDGNTIGVWMKNIALVSNSSANSLPSLYFTMTPYSPIFSCCVYINDMTSQFHTIKYDAPGEFGSGGQPNSFFIENWIHEQAPGTEPVITIDTQANAPGVGATPVGISNISLHNVNFSDPIGGPAAHAVFQLTAPFSTAVVGASLDEVAGTGSLLNCAAGVTCDQQRILSFLATNTPDQGAFGSGVSVSANSINISAPLKLSLASTQFGANPPNPALAQVLPPPNQFQVTSTGAGGLAAGTYCMVVVGIDARPTPGTTLPSPEICQTVGASSVINLSWQQENGQLNQVYSGFRLYYGFNTGAGGENNYIALGAGGNPYPYAFTSTAGAIGGVPPNSPTAYLSWLFWDTGKSCILCTSSGAGSSWSLGIGEPNTAAGVKLAVAGGTIQGEGGIQAGTDAAFNASPRGAYNAFLPNLTSAAATYQRMTLDKAITVTRLQLVLGTAGAGCTTQSTVSITDGTSSVTLTTANGSAIYDSGAVSQNFAATNLDIKIATAASGCTTAPQNANVTAQYRMQ
jgi:hypothetical protein